jgi:hypothetical protein
MKNVFLVPAAFLALHLSTIDRAAAAPLTGEGQTDGTKIVVRDVKRDAANMVTLRFQLVNDGDAQLKTYGVLGDLFTLDAVTLIDGANKKRYLVVKDAAGKCLCSELKDDVVKGSKFNLWAKFPAPPADVKTITVMVPGFEPVDAPVTTATP